MKKETQIQFGKTLSIQLTQSFDRGHEAGRNEIFRQLTDVRASQQAHERKVRREKDDELGRMGGSPNVDVETFTAKQDFFASQLADLAVAQMQEIDEILATEFHGVYKAGGV